MSILDNAKQIAKAVEEIHNLGLYQRVLNLHSDTIELVEENKRIRSENDELHKALKLREHVQFKEPCYYQEGDETPFCPSYMECKDTAVHVVFVFNNSGATRWDCPGCKTTYLVKKDRGVEPAARSINLRRSPWV